MFILLKVFPAEVKVKEPLPSKIGIIDPTPVVSVIPEIKVKEP